ncbi:MAG TPA: ABC transporter substrate-binding protein [Acidimicrobiia bacterium]|nr:ABC transporter substrate-binding protein [Acidimicrobiia bacterium]
MDPNRRVRAEDVVRRPVDRRTFLAWSGRTSLAGMAMLGAWGPLGGVAGGRRFVGVADSVTGRLPKRLKVGVIVPTSGIGQFLGEIVDRSLNASLQHVRAERLMKGTEVDYEIVNAPAEQFADATTAAYNKLVADPDVIGILWCTPNGIREARPQIRRDNIPVIGVYADLWSEGTLYPDGSERSIFQMLLPDRMSFDALARYAAKDRGYRTAGLIHDSTTLANAGDLFQAAAKKQGLRVAGTEEFQIFSGDYGAQLQRLKQDAPQALFVWGLSDNTAGIIRGLDALDAGYVDTPTAKSTAEWRPHILGYPGGTGEKKWAELAGDAAKVGTITAWYLGGLIGGPQFAIRGWLADAGEQAPSGGEETPANGFWALLAAAKKAGSTDRAEMVRALEGLSTRFAGLKYGFTPKRHLSLTPDEICLISLERYTGPVETDPPYELGREWETTFPEIRPDYVGPAHLLRPTLEANKRANPGYMTQILEEGWGTQCTKTPPGALGADVKMSKACKVH